MSASPVARQVATTFQSIPSRRVVLNDPAQLPVDYSSTPGGTLYSTTPGGTRIVYERAFMMNLRNSPLGRTPPNNVTNIPSELLAKGGSSPTSPFKTVAPPAQPNGKVEPTIDEAAEQFEMDI